MTRDEAVARIKVGLGFIAGTVFDADIVTMLQHVQQEAEKEPELPIWLKKQYVGLATAANTRTTNLPSDFIREFDGDQMSVTDTDGNVTEVVKNDEGYLRLRYPDPDDTSDVTVPRGYAIANGQFRWYPLPSDVFTLNGTYYFKDDLLTTNIENRWLRELPELLMGRAGYNIAVGKRDKDAMAFFSEMKTVAIAKLHLKTTADENAGSKPIMGGED